MGWRGGLGLERSLLGPGPLPRSQDNGSERLLQGTARAGGSRSLGQGALVQALDPGPPSRPWGCTEVPVRVGGGLEPPPKGQCWGRGQLEVSREQEGAEEPLVGV